MSCSGWADGRIGRGRQAGAGGTGIASKVGGSRGRRAEGRRSRDAGGAIVICREVKEWSEKIDEEEKHGAGVVSRSEL